MAAGLCAHLELRQPQLPARHQAPRARAAAFGRSRPASRPSLDPGSSVCSAARRPSRRKQPPSKQQMPQNFSVSVAELPASNRSDALDSTLSSHPAGAINAAPSVSYFRFFLDCEVAAYWGCFAANQPPSPGLLRRRGAEATSHPGGPLMWPAKFGAHLFLIYRNALTED